ncbi:PilZ domain-containing protein [Halomonas shantousis]
MAAQKALSLTIRDEQTLLSAYMPWLEHGGMFVPTRERYTPGQIVHLLLTLPDETERMPVSGTVVWISPPGVGGRRMPGIGVHFDDKGHAMREHIETRLAGLLGQGTPTYTF